MTDRPIATLLTGGSFFEGPRWHDGAWWVSDFYRHRVIRVTSDGEESLVVTVPSQPSGLGWLPDGSLVMSSMTDQKILRFADGELSVLADISQYCGGWVNDLIVDVAGHIYAGNFGFDFMNGGTPAQANLVRIDPDGSSCIAASGFDFPNGCVILPDGSLTDRRLWAQFGSTPGDPQSVWPDGCGVDAENHIWTADARGGRVVRVSPDGAIVDQIRVPEGVGVFACILGGADGRTLLMCCAPDSSPKKRSAAHEAVLLTTTVDIPRAGRP
jgi:sugar lactone lactonase YvrE